MMSFTKSLIVGVHDGYELLQFSLPSLNIVPVDEVLMVLDRVKNVDKYRRIIHNYVPKAKILEKNFAVRKNRPNETFQYGTGFC
jgi:hypothetical protein